MKTAIEQLAAEVLTLDYLTIDQCARLINVIAKYHYVESEQLKEVFEAGKIDSLKIK